MSQQELADQKQALVQLLSTTDRGRRVSDAQQQAITQQVAWLEAHNPTPIPTAATDALDGNWLTLFTTSRDLLRLAKGLPFVTTGEIYQAIRVETQQVFNVAEIQGSGGLVSLVPQGVFAVAATFAVVSEQRVEVTFQRFFLGNSFFMNYQIDSFLDLLQYQPDRIAALKIDIQSRPQKGWLDITYLDQDLRIGRGSEGSLFILEKVHCPSKDP
ncbi:MAG: PAP/fibrillin family protein [Cyanobacteriota bacterium]|nr:PAP/fibrillin family protein [Cyanobacteriota bacterium]